MTDLSLGERERAQRRLDDVLDKLSDLSADLRICEAQREVAMIERQICENMLTAGAATLARVLALCDGRGYIRESDVLTALLPGEPSVQPPV